MRTLSLAAAAFTLAACSPERDPDAADVEQPGAAGRNEPEPAAPAAPRPPLQPPHAQRHPMLGEAIARAEWARAGNRADCAPLALASDGGGVAVDATARRAQFSGGWGVAFDLPRLRSAFGFAGPGLLPADRADFAGQVEALGAQWPHLRRWGAGENLPAGSAAGYGVVGAEPYPDDNPAGTGLHSLAYLRIPGQACQYNVWSRISRVHLETILGLLRVVEVSGAAL
ncbi:hypothetical protein [Sphingomonas sp.]|uniref:hypothetical protein n=1 Tax=Sphingomonas sp. TaxID=28214 RepID=UPI00286DA50F|nr:hypothetical protein [Sphingomonas sp.]